MAISTPLKNISQIGNLPQIGMKIKHIWNHHRVINHHCPLIRAPTKGLISRGGKVGIRQLALDSPNLMQSHQNPTCAAESVASGLRMFVREVQPEGSSVI